LDFAFFVGDVIIEVGLCIFGLGHQALGVNAKSQFFDSIFIGNKAIIWAFRFLD